MTVDEIIARALFKQRPNQVRLAGPAPIRARSDEDAAAIVSALEAAGYAIVPVEPTQEMLEAGNAARNLRFMATPDEQTQADMREKWTAMLESISPGYTERRAGLKAGKDVG